MIDPSSESKFEKLRPSEWDRILERAEFCRHYLIRAIASVLIPVGIAYVGILVLALATWPGFVDSFTSRAPLPMMVIGSISVMMLVGFLASMLAIVVVMFLTATTNELISLRMSILIFGGLASVMIIVPWTAVLISIQSALSKLGLGAGIGVVIGAILIGQTGALLSPVYAELASQPRRPMRWSVAQLFVLVTWVAAGFLLLRVIRWLGWNFDDLKLFVVFLVVQTFTTICFDWGHSIWSRNSS
ncbi:MAG: hypothetical protein AAFN77_11780 [Planctomycetota bacterium]